MSYLFIFCVLFHLISIHTVSVVMCCFLKMYFQMGHQVGHYSFLI